jgi:hypothetical protein
MPFEVNLMPTDNAYDGIKKHISENKTKISKLDASLHSLAIPLLQFLFFSAASPACIYLVFDKYGLKPALFTALFFFGMHLSLRVISIMENIDSLKSLTEVLQLVLDDYDEQGRGSSRREEKDDDKEDPTDKSDTKTESALQVLEIGPTQDKRKIRKAYLRKMKKFHPDKGGSTEEAKKINAAYEHLMAA